MRLLTLALPIVWIASCTQPAEETDPCSEQSALSTCLSPTQTDAYYIEQSSAYFDTMDYTVTLDAWPPYSELVARWEWPPWLKLTAFTLENIEATDTLLKLYPSVVLNRDCQAFDVQPFGRCTVEFFYDEHNGKGCPIYEEFTFNDAGEITFIEAWSDLPGYRPMADDDPWAEEEGIARLSSRIPGLGNSEGRIDLDSEAMATAAASDADVADFVERANDWYATWIAEVEAAGDDLWAVGCGW